MAWALAQLQHKDRQLLAGIADELITLHQPALARTSPSTTGAAVTGAAAGARNTSGVAPSASANQHMLPNKRKAQVQGLPSSITAADVVALTGTAVSLAKLGIRHPRLMSTALVATCAACDNSPTSTSSKAPRGAQARTLRHDVHTPGALEVAPLLWALAEAQHPCSQQQLLTLVNALGWQHRSHHEQQHQRQGPPIRSLMDPGLVSMALMALPRLGCDPGPSRLAAACTALQGRVYRLSTHTLCELVAAFAELQVNVMQFWPGECYFLPAFVSGYGS